MSLINANGQVDQNAAATNTPAKSNFIHDLAARLGVSVSTPEQSEDNDDNDENHVDYRDEHDYKHYDDDHDDIEHRGKLVFIDDRVWDEDFARNIFDDDPNY